MNEQTTLPEFLSYDELASYLGVPKGTIYTWVHQKRIPHIRITGRLIRFRRSEVLRWLDDKHVNSEGNGGALS